MAYVQITYTAYPLAPNPGYASESSVQVVDHLGVVATLAPTRHLRELHAATMAAALDGVGVDQVERHTDYRYRDNRNEWASATITPAEVSVRYARACSIPQRRYHALLSHDPDAIAAALASIERALGDHRTQTDELTLEQNAAEDAAEEALS